MWAHWTVNALFLLQQLTDSLHVRSLDCECFIFKPWDCFLENSFLLQNWTVKWCILWQKIFSVCHWNTPFAFCHTHFHCFYNKNEFLTWTNVRIMCKISMISHARQGSFKMSQRTSELLQEKWSIHSPVSSHVDLSTLNCAIQIIYWVLVLWLWWYWEIINSKIKGKVTFLHHEVVSSLDNQKHHLLAVSLFISEKICWTEFWHPNLFVDSQKLLLKPDLEYKTLPVRVNAFWALWVQWPDQNVHAVHLPSIKV